MLSLQTTGHRCTFPPPLVVLSICLWFSVAIPLGSRMLWWAWLFMLAWVVLRLVFMFNFLRTSLLFLGGSKRVGFAVTDIKHITMPHFDIYFHMWRDREENWMREFKKWQREEESSWLVVSRKKSSKKVSFARILNQPSPVRKSVPAELKNIIKFGRLSFELANAPSSFLAVFSNSKSSFRHNTVPRALVASSTVFSRIKASLI
jgi:hypothetical protein